jgi:hypothetical protein
MSFPKDPADLCGVSPCAGAQESWRNNIRTTWGGQRDGVHLPGV